MGCCLWLTETFFIRKTTLSEKKEQCEQVKGVQVIELQHDPNTERQFDKYQQGETNQKLEGQSNSTDKKTENLEMNQLKQKVENYSNVQNLSKSKFRSSPKRRSSKRASIVSQQIPLFTIEQNPSKLQAGSYITVENALSKSQEENIEQKNINFRSVAELQNIPDFEVRLQKVFMRMKNL